MSAKLDAPKAVIETLRRTKARAHELQEAIASLSVSVECEVEQLPPLQRAQCECVCIQAALALASWLHSLHGEASDYVDVLQAERTMLAAYEKKVQAAVAKQELGRKKRGVEINVDAAHRFITHAIPDLSAAQKAELQQVAIDAHGRRDGVAKVSRLASEPDKQQKLKTVNASKGTSAVERARKRRKGQQGASGAASAAANPLDMLDDMFKDT